MRRYAPTEHLKCKLYKRIMNSSKFEEIPIMFKAEIIDDETIVRYQVIAGVIGTKAALRIKSSNAPSNIAIDDKIEILGKIHMVKGIGVITSDNETLLSDKYSNEYILKTAPKIITF